MRKREYLCLTLQQVVIEDGIKAMNIITTNNGKDIIE